MKHKFKKVKNILSFILFFVIFMVPFSTVWADTYVYDSLNRVIEVDYDSGEKVNYSYDASGNIKNITHVPAVVDKITLNYSDLKIKVNETKNIVVTAYYDNTSKVVTSGVQYESTNTKVATVDSQGNIKAVKGGQATINVKYMGKSAAIDIKVNSGKKSLSQIIQDIISWLLSLFN